MVNLLALFYLLIGLLCPVASAARCCLLVVKLFKQKITPYIDGLLGSCIYEERSEMRNTQ